MTVASRHERAVAVEVETVRSIFVHPKVFGPERVERASTPIRTPFDNLLARRKPRRISTERWVGVVVDAYLRDFIEITEQGSERRKPTSHPVNVGENKELLDWRFLSQGSDVEGKRFALECERAVVSERDLRITRERFIKLPRFAADEEIRSRCDVCFGLTC